MCLRHPGVTALSYRGHAGSSREHSLLASDIPVEWDSTTWVPRKGSQRPRFQFKLRLH